MINFVSSWAEQIVVAVIIGTIIELILPNNKNKKYIQMVIGVYILFNIISPIIKNKEILTVDNIGENVISSDYVVDQSSMDKRLEKIYLEEIEKDVKKRFEEGGFNVSKCNVNAVLDTNKKNAGIHLITVKIKGQADESEILKIKNNILIDYEIDEQKIKIIIN